MVGTLFCPIILRALLARAIVAGVTVLADARERSLVVLIRLYVALALAGALKAVRVTKRAHLLLTSLALPALLACAHTSGAVARAVAGAVLRAKLLGAVVVAPAEGTLAHTRSLIAHTMA